MALSYRTTARTTNFIECILRDLQTIVSAELDCSEVQWQHREIAETHITEERFDDEYVRQHKQVRIKGRTTNCDVVHCIVTFDGYVRPAHDRDMVGWDENLDLYGPNEISLEILEKGFNRKESLYRLNDAGIWIKQ